MACASSKHKFWYNMASLAEKIPPMRMCILCRIREPQKDLMRLKIVQGQIIAFDGSGRSLYLCSRCLMSDKLAIRLSKLKNITQTKEQIYLRIEELKW